MAQQTLEDRVAALERQVADLTQKTANEARKDWRRTIGMFTGDEAMKQIDAAGKRIRETDRRLAKKASANGRKKPKR